MTLNTICKIIKDLIGVLFTPDRIDYGHEDDPYIKRCGPVFQVIDVVLNPVIHVFQQAGFAAETIHLCPAGDARF